MPVIDIIIESPGYPETFSIVRWLVDDGAEVRWDQPLLEIENEKAVVEEPAGYPGKLRIVLREGVDLPDYTVVGQLEVSDEVYARYVRHRLLFTLTLHLSRHQWEALHRARGGSSVEAYVHRLVEERVNQLAGAGGPATA